MGCVFAEQIRVDVRWRRVGIDLGRFCGVDLFGESACVCFGRQASGHRGKVGVAEPMGAVSERQPHRLSDEMNKSGGVGRHRAQIEHLKDVQDLRHVHAAGTRRREADDLVSAIGRLYWFASPGIIVGEVVAGHQSAVVAHPLFRFQRERAAIKPVGGVLPDGAVRPGQVRLPEPVAVWPGVAVAVEENARAVRELAEFFHH